ncbi:uncharacterized protein LOC106172798 [Lingula anatina]|uniref:Uncharacterized protein LOC106172798 n=1 Tax=Lingula anatina TaxID=7574 RepID=A0A1S3JGX8_LINAN|nr:uncharacterized protein LOC106172798 [Lingula anatina]|eukprot:XP_013409154.1 uncharacterized protein LOC106172798 [Lingula anatina]
MSTTRQEEIWAMVKGVNAVTNNVGKSLNLYRQWAPNFDQDNADIQYNGPKFTAQTIDELFGENKDALILDAGAGTGLVGEELQNLGFTNLVALDGSQEMLDVANQKGVYKSSVCSFLGPDRLDIDSRQYDCVVCVGTMAAGHANASCLPELIRITKSGGYVVIAMREIHIPDCGYDGKSWDDWLKIHEDNGLWKKIEIRNVENWLSGVYVGVNHYYGPKFTAQKIDELFGENKDVLILDAGAGTGLVGKELQNLGFTNLEALDGSQDMLDVANQKGIYKRSICSLLGPNRLDIDPGQYDCVVCAGTMAADHANAGCLPELIRITKSGGYVVIATREALIPDCGYDGKSWDDWLKIHEDNGLWKKVEIRRVENWLAGFYVGVINVYRVI